MSKYLFLASLSYAFPIMRPLQKAIKERGDEVAWFFDNKELCSYLREDETELETVDQVMEYDPAAVFTVNDHMYYFLPGIKVMLFHGFNINKRGTDGLGVHFRLRGWFDLYCAPDTSSYEGFNELSKMHRYFKAVQTGWPKIDGFFEPDGTLPLPQNKRPTILYSSTFTKWITSTPYLYDQIDRLAATKDWDWLITFHPKMDAETVEKYKMLQNKHSNVKFIETDNNVELLKQADVMVCDSSSIIVEFLYFLKPVVTFKNTSPGDYLIDIDDPAKLEESIDLALSRPAELMTKIEEHINSIHPCRDGRSSQRVMQAVDSFIANDMATMAPKPLNLFRKFKMRKKLGYFKFGARKKK